MVPAPGRSHVGAARFHAFHRASSPARPQSSRAGVEFQHTLSCEGPSSASVRFIIEAGLAGDYISAYCGRERSIRAQLADAGGHTVTRVAGAKLFSALDPRGLAIYALDLVVVGITYFGLANVSLTVGSFECDPALGARRSRLRGGPLARYSRVAGDFRSSLCGGRAD